MNITVQRRVNAYCSRIIWMDTRWKGAQSRVSHPHGGLCERGRCIVTGTTYRRVGFNYASDNHGGFHSGKVDTNNRPLLVYAFEVFSIAVTECRLTFAMDQRCPYPATPH